MLIKIARIVLLLTIVFAASVTIPDFYWKLFESSHSAPYVYYSSVSNKFLTKQSINKKMKKFDSEGKELSTDQLAQLTPMYSFRLLKYKDMLPDSIRGWEVNIDEIKLNNINIKIKPAEINSPKIEIFPILESKPDGPKLGMPAEYSRFSTRLDFIDCETNTIDEELSADFTNALVSKGFVFPATGYWGNPSTLKAFDEGYFIRDANNKMYQLKKVHNKPLCKNVNLPENIDIAFIKMTEMPLREFYGVLVTKTNEVYLISYDNYKLIKLPIKNYDHTRMEIMIKGNVFYRIVSVLADESIEVFAIDRDYNLVDTYKKEWGTKYESGAGSVFNVMFPFSIEMTDFNSGFVDFNFYFSGLNTLPFILISLILVVVLRRYREEDMKDNPFDYVVVLFTGIFGLIAIAMIRGEK